jgi:uncharacterized protein (TIGR02217 family)
MAVLDIHLPETVERGAESNIGFLTTVYGSNGRERRHALWAEEKCTYNISYGMEHKTRGASDLPAVLDLFRICRGRLYGFLFRDWADYEADNSYQFTGNGVLDTFNLIKRYDIGGDIYDRRITRPVAETLVVRVNGSIVSHTLGELGVVELAAPPANGTVITASFDFDVPVRFMEDQLKVRSYSGNNMEIPNIELTEIKEYDE